MTNNTTAPALTDEEREKLIDLVDRLIRNPDAVTAKDCIIGNDVRTVQWIAEHTRALLTSPRAAVPAPEGWKLVPVKPTDEMVEAGHAEYERALIGNRKDIGAAFLRRWAAMLDAAPAAPVAEAAPYFSGVSDLIIRDVCEMEPANPDLNDTICIDVSDLQAIVKRHTEVCATCNGHGMIGGPSFYAPDEGGVQCPDCAQAVAADGAQTKDVVTREQVMEWARTANIETGWFTEQLIAALGDFAILARAAVSPATADERAAFAYHDDPSNTGVGTYCNPGDRREPRWLLQFEDADRGASIYESEHEARTAFAHAEGRGYNCYLFSPTLRASQAAAPAEAREPVGRFDKSLNQIRWRDGLVNADFADRQPFYTYPVGATAEARYAVDPEPLAWMLEWTHSGDERGMRLYDDERHCILDAESDGGVCVPLGRIVSAPADAGEAVGVADSMPGANGFTMACFEAAKVPIGTKLYAAAQGAQGGKGGEA
ncbi:hypothetical protein [Burkholderia gladioli]|uniref:hypothetical protein n=1 Tax=Burkholderia gladioli TaxID=28095 RepID=UPI0013DE1108|nr:hypothetical protein [Burkholderia gladioli]